MAMDCSARTPMKKLLTSLGFSLAVVAGLPLVSASSVFAQEEITPNTPPVGANYGLFQSADSEAVRVRLADGSSQTYPLGNGVAIPSSVNSGDLVLFNANRKGVLKEFSAAEKSEVVIGTVDRIEGDSVTLLPDDGLSPMGTTIPEGTISRLGLAEGQRLRVTKYQGSGITRVCALPAPVVEVAPPPVVAPPPIPVRGGPEPLPDPEPIRALW